MGTEKHGMRAGKGRPPGVDAAKGGVEGLALLLVVALVFLLMGGLAIYIVNKSDPDHGQAAGRPPSDVLPSAPAPEVSQGTAGEGAAATSSGQDRPQVSPEVEGAETTPPGHVDEPGTAPDRRTVMTHVDECFSVKADVPDVIPLSLTNVYKAHRSLYWMYVHLENDCDRTLQLMISRRPPNAPSDPLIKYKVGPHDKISKPLPKGGDVDEHWDASFELLKPEADAFDPIRLEFTVEDKESGKVLWEETTKEIEILPRTTVSWDADLPKGLILASLGAWVQKPQPAVKDEARKLLEGLDRKWPLNQFATDWFDLLCGRYFGTEDAPLVPRASLNWNWRELPPSGLQTVRTSRNLLDGVRLRRRLTVNGIEAVVFLAALTEGAGAFDDLRTAVFVRIVEENGVKVPEFLLAWSADGSSWSALNVSKPGEGTCSDNREESSRWLNGLLEGREDYRGRLAQGQGRWSPDSDKGHGVILDSEAGIAAVDFHVSSSDFKIRGLP